MTKLTDIGMISTLVATLIVAALAFGQGEVRAQAKDTAVHAQVTEYHLNSDGHMKVTVTAERVL